MSEYKSTDVLSVSQLVDIAKREVASLGTFVVTGEVAGFRGQHRTGHCYFQMRDESSSVDVIVWRNVYQASNVELEDGMLIQMTGYFDVYDKTGKLSFVAKRLEVAGEGMLRQQVAALAKKLQAEGLMDPSIKRLIPEFCNHICMVTSLSGSVREDVCRTLKRRNPLVSIDIVGCSVQGPQAPQTIIRALQYAANQEPDAILLVRGGGSFEDLMCFNDEALARAIRACPVPVITGIGHEPDTSIADMVSDRRCSTPTAAAESVAPAINELITNLDAQAKRLGRVAQHQLGNESQKLDESLRRTTVVIQTQLAEQTRILAAYATRPSLSNPTYLLDRRNNDLSFAEQRLFDAIKRVVDQKNTMFAMQVKQLLSTGTKLTTTHDTALARAASTLEALSPLKVLGRGYAIAKNDNGLILTSVAQLEKGDNVEVMLGQGSFEAEVCVIHAKTANVDT